jgi:hypothetical protein
MMNRHTKIAILVAPLLIVLGYILSDVFIETKADRSKVIPLQPEADCAVLQDECILTSGDFKIAVSDKAGMTIINSTFPLDSVVLFLVDENNKATAYPLSKIQTSYYWQAQTPLRELAEELVSEQAPRYKLRLIASIKGGEYISEFYTRL